MSRSISQKRPWLAAVLAALATGLGHLYLRRWRRALLWLGVLFITTVLFVDPAAINGLATGGATDPLSIAAIVIVGGLSVVDAYLLAHVHNRVAHLIESRDGRLTHCPDCGREVDPDLDFCHWCTTEIGDIDAVPAEELDERDGD